MKPRSRADREASKARHRKALKTKRGDASKTVSSSPGREDVEVARLTRELNEAREQQTATAEVLRIISVSRGELKPVFQAMLENATRLCQASFGNLLLQEGDGVRIAAMHNAPWSASSYSIRGRQT
jgi:hypothetical protein